jgi:hypothetical protein
MKFPPGENIYSNFDVATGRSAYPSNSVISSFQTNGRQARRVVRKRNQQRFV